MQGVRRERLMWGKKIAKRGSIAKHCIVQNGAPELGYQGSRVLRRFVWKIKSHWKEAKHSKRTTVEYSYDLQSYYMNFDDGFFIDNILTQVSNRTFSIMSS